MPSSTIVSGTIWRAEYGEISEQAQFRVGYIGSLAYEATFPIGFLSDMISVLAAVTPLAPGVLASGVSLQARKLNTFHYDVVVEPRSDSSPPAYMQFYSEYTSDLITVLAQLSELVTTVHAGDWDNSEQNFEEMDERYAHLDDEGDLVINGQPVGNIIAGSGVTAEGAVDAVAASLVAGANVTITYNDAADTITVAATGGSGGGLDTEQVIDAVAASLVAGTNVTITYNDAAGTITIASTGGGGGSSLPDPNADKIRFWDDSAGAEAYLAVGTGLQITGTTLNSTAAAGTSTSLDIEMISGFYDFPSTIGTGVIRVNAYGPTIYTSSNVKINGTASATLPTYIGLGAGKARLRYFYDTEVG